jgi:hypothetical protein
MEPYGYQRLGASRQRKKERVAENYSTSTVVRTFAYTFAPRIPGVILHRSDSAGPAVIVIEVEGQTISPDPGQLPQENG